MNSEGKQTVMKKDGLRVYMHTFLAASVSLKTHLARPDLLLIF